MSEEEELIEGVLTFEATTLEIHVSVQSYFLDGQSKPEKSKYFWAYRIMIENQSNNAVTLKGRHWIITDGAGKIEEVEGDGVIGEQPLILPGQHFTYTSGCPLNTPTGFMHGTYEMEDMDGECFNVAIPAFSLDSPYHSTKIN